MDGTGKLFKPICDLLSAPTIIIPLPQSGSQSYEFLADHIEAQLPNEAFIIVAESFSGPIAALLAAKGLKYLKGIVFVATFLSCPKPALVSLAKLMPLKALLGVPLAKSFISSLLLHDFNYLEFKAALEEVPHSTLIARLTSICNLKMVNRCVDLPVLYLCAASDYLVSSNQIGLFKQNFKNIRVEYIEGTHFLLQTSPKDCSEVIGKFLGIDRVS